MSERVLTLRELNRTPPFVGLWTRLDRFRREALTELIHDRHVVRATMMRHTLHLVQSIAARCSSRPAGCARRS